MEQLEDRRLLAIGAQLVAGNAVITGDGLANYSAVEILNAGQLNETLRVSDPSGVNAASGFTQAGPNAAETLTSNITGRQIQIDLGNGDDTVVLGNGTLDAFSQAISVIGGGGNDSVVINDAGDTDSNLYRLTPAAFTRPGLAPIPLASVEMVQINAGLGNDSLTADMATGLFPFDAEFNGGSQTGGTGDLLTVIGNATFTSFYLPSNTTPGSGVVGVEGRRINFTGLEPVIVSAMYEFTFVTPKSNDVVEIDMQGGANRISGQSGGTTFESVTFFGIPHVKIDTAQNDGPLATTNDVVDFLTDLVSSGLETFTVETGQGTDVVDASVVQSKPLTILAGEGDDTLSGGGQSDWLDGGTGRDVLSGGAGDDVLLGGDEADVLLGGNGNDTLDGGLGTDTLEGGADNDRLSGGGDDDRITGGTGNDTIEGGAGTDRYTFVGTAGDDSITVSAEAVTVIVSLTGATDQDRLIGVEQLDIDTGDSVANGPEDTVTVNPLLGTDLLAVNVLGPAIDLNFDKLIVNGTDAGETITLGESADGQLQILGVGPVIYARDFFLDFTADGDRVQVNGNGGDDTIAIDPSVAIDVLFELNGGQGNDLLTGGAGSDRLDGGPGDDMLVGGGGTDNVTGGAGNDTILAEGTPGDDSLSVSLIGTFLVTQDRSGTTNYSSIGTAGIERVAVVAGSGVDELTVAPLGTISVDIDGGTPFAGTPGDSLTFSGNNSTFVDAQGSSPGQGVFSVGGNNPVSFQGIEEFTVTAVGDLTTNGTNDDDHIAIVGTAADAFEFSLNDAPSVSFSQVTSLSLNGLNGDDDVDVELNGFNPVAFIVNGGGAATGWDTLRVSGAQQVFDDPTWTPSDTNGGMFSFDLGPSLAVSEIEHLIYDAENEAEFLTVVGTASSDTIVHTPGENPTAGRVQVNALLPIEYINLTGALTIDGQGGSNDLLVASGTAHDDFFSVATNGDVELANFTGTWIPISQVNIEALVLEGFDGDDSFLVEGPLPYTNTIVNGGGPDASDVLNLTGTAGVDSIVVNLESSTIEGFGGTVSFTGVEDVNLNGNGDADTLTVNGTSLDDELTYRPTGAESGIFSNRTSDDPDEPTTVFAFSAIAGTFTAAGGAASADDVVVEATNSRDTITINATNRTTNTVQVNALKAVALATDTEVVRAQGRVGNDTFVVNPALGVAGSLDNLLIYVDGGEPGASDALVVQDPDNTPLDASDFAVVNRSRQPDEGVVRVFRDTPGAGNEPAQLPDISYTDVEVVSPNVFVNAVGDPNLLILGPDENEPNEFRANAAFVGSGGPLQIQHAAIFPNANEHPFVPADDDFYRVVAELTGTLDFQVYFREVPEFLPGAGNIEIQVQDLDGTVVAGFGTNDATNDERVRIPAVAGQTYYLRVFGVNGNVVNGYDVNVINAAPPTPFDLELQDNPVDPAYNCAVPTLLNSDSGRSQFDNVTCDNNPTLFFRLDDGIFLHDLPGNSVNDTPPDEVIPIPFRAGPAQPVLPGYAIAIFDEGNSPQPATAPQTPLGFATAVVGQEGVYTFTTPLLGEGSHFLTARVQMIDPAAPQQNGFGPRSESLEIIVDTIDPPVFFGLQSQALDGLHPDSDTGNPIMESTFSDRITSDRTPTFWGLAEADTVVRLYVDLTPNNGVNNLDVFIGETTATPFDGNNQFGNAAGDHPNGQWEITSTVNLNDPALGFPKDGLRQILVNAEDVAGNIPTPQVLEIFIDTQGPRVFDPAGPEPAVFITGQPQYDVFDPKPSINGPTPLAPSITVNIEDLPIRVPGAPTSFLYPALKTFVDTVNPATGLLIGAGESPLEPEYFEVRGDYNGVIPIQSVIFRSDVVNNGSVATGEIILTFFEPLPDDRYTLIIRDALTDHPGNALDGEMDTIEPENSATLQFPSGDLIPGNEFNARFTIDTRPELGVWASGNAWIDTNGNETIDPRNADFVNRDIIYTFGNGNSGTNRAFTSDDFIAGNFRDPGPDGFLGTADDGVADGFDKLAVYGSIGNGSAGPWRFLVDGNNDGVPDLIDTDANGASDIQSVANINFNGLPVAGNFAPTSGDEVGIFTGTTWYFDINGDFQLDPASAIVTSMRGYPIVGDFDGDGLDDLGTWADDVFQFDLSGAGAATGPLPGNPRINGQIDATINFGFIGVRERPLAADVDQDGIDDIGLWSPDQSGISPDEGAEWFFLVSNDFNPVDGTNDRTFGQVNTLNHPFKPVPFGKDLYMQLGSSYSIPIIGNFDPPATGGVIDLTEEEVTDLLSRLDVNQDGYATPIDALIVINKLNDGGTQAVFTGIERLLDVSGDGTISPIDVLNIFNYLSDNNFIQGEGEGAAGFTTPTPATASFHATVANSSGAFDVASGQYLAVADTMRITFAPIVSAAPRGLEDVFALLDDADIDIDAAGSDDASSIDSLLAAFESGDLFGFDSSADSLASSALDELLNDEELFDFDQLAADILSSYDRGDDLA